MQHFTEYYHHCCFPPGCMSDYARSKFTGWQDDSSISGNSLTFKQRLSSRIYATFTQWNSLNGNKTPSDPREDSSTRCVCFL